LLTQPGREAKIRFLQTFPGIGPKYARNIMMDVYHEDFRNSIALDVRIKAISDSLGLSFSSYADHESFYLRFCV
jgi:endonuclease III